MAASIAPEYTVDHRDEGFLLSVKQIAGEPVVVKADSYDEGLSQSQIDFQFEVEELDFNALTERLVAFEKDLGQSSAELMRLYLDSEHDVLDEFEDWADAFFLYLGTREIRRFSCP